MSNRILRPLDIIGEIASDGDGVTLVKLSAIVDGREAELTGVVSHPEPFRFHVFERFDNDDDYSPKSFRVYPELKAQFAKIMQPFLPKIVAFATR
jgi:hypothetical protein